MGQSRYNNIEITNAKAKKNQATYEAFCCHIARQAIDNDDAKFKRKSNTFVDLNTSSEIATILWNP